MAGTRDTELLAACKAGDLAAAQTLLDAGAHLEARDEYEETPLIIATRGGHVELVRHLLARGADVRAVRINGGSAITFTEHVEITRLLLDHGAPLADVSLGGTFDLESLRLLVARGADLTKPDKMGNTALDIAVWQRSPERIQLFRELGADASTAYPHAIRQCDVVTLTQLIGDPPAPWIARALFLACAAGYAEMARDLVDLGAPKAPTLRARAGYGAEIEWLLAVDDPAAETLSARDQALFLAVLQEDPDGVRRALAAGARLDARDARGRTPVELGARAKDRQLRALLGHGDDAAPPRTWRDCPVCQTIPEGDTDPPPPAKAQLETIPGSVAGYDSLLECPRCQALFCHRYMHDSDDPTDLDSIERLTPEKALAWMDDAVHGSYFRSNPRLEARFAAALAEADFRPRPIGALVPLLSAPDRAIVERAAFELGAWGPAARAAIGPLVALFDNVRVAERAARALSRIGAAAVPQIIAVIASRNPRSVRAAASALGRMGPAAAAARGALIAAIHAAQDPRLVQLKPTLFWALGRLGYSAASVECLLTQFDVNVDELHEAVAALGLEALPQVLGKLASDDRYHVIRAMKVLQRWGPPAFEAAAPTLQAIRRSRRLTMVTAEAERTLSSLRGWRRAAATS